ncbi:MAG: hypothetical protein ACRDK1_10425, partial [Solirubrobacterales bacterium]
WKVRAANNDFDNPREASAVAYCDKSEPGLDVQSDQVTIKPGSKSTLDLGCRHGDKPLSGGFASTYRAATGPTDSPDAAFAFTSRPISGDRWRVSAFAIGPRVVKAKAASLARRAAGPTLTAYAYCK